MNEESPAVKVLLVVWHLSTRVGHHVPAVYHNGNHVGGGRGKVGLRDGIGPMTNGIIRSVLQIERLLYTPNGLRDTIKQIGTALIGARWERR